MPGISRSPHSLVHDHRIHYLFVMASKGSMRAAADHLGMAASSISRQIGQLEREYNVELVERIENKMRLTEAGQAVFEYYGDRLQQHQSLMERLENIRREKAGAVTIAAGEGLLTNSLIAAVQAGSSTKHSPSFTVTVATSQEVQDLVANGTAQIGLLFGKADEIRLRIHQSASQPIRLIMRPDHELATRISVDLQTIASFPLVIPSDGFRVSEIVQTAFRDQGLKPNILIASNALDPILNAVRQSLGVALLPEILASDAIRTGVLLSREVLCDRFRDTQVFIATRAGHRLPSVALSILKSLSSTLSKMS